MQDLSISIAKAWKIWQSWAIDRHNIWYIKWCNLCFTYLKTSLQIKQAIFYQIFCVFVCLVSERVFSYGHCDSSVWTVHVRKWAAGQIGTQIDDLAQDCSISIALAMEILQSCTKLSKIIRHGLNLKNQTSSGLSFHIIIAALFMEFKHSAYCSCT